jgi:hypothetical protein
MSERPPSLARATDVHWELTPVDVHFTGKGLFFKTISEQHHEERGALRQVPGNLNPVQAVEI